MNYRHHYHAGNFADLLKHAVLLDLIIALQAPGTPLQVVETHAGAGLYALDGPEARRSGEAQAGIVRLLAAPAAPPRLADLARRIRAFNDAGPLRRYPGSPLLAIQALRAGDAYVGFELRPDDQAALDRACRIHSAAGVLVQTANADGYAAAQTLIPPKGQRLVLIDPPFERGDEARRIVEASGTLVSKPGTTVAIWCPIKDLDALDRLRAQLEAVAEVGWIVEARLRPLTDPLRMNGCAMIVLGRGDAADSARESAAWVVQAAGDAGGGARLERFGSVRKQPVAGPGV